MTVLIHPRHEDSWPLNPPCAMPSGLGPGNSVKHGESLLHATWSQEHQEVGTAASGSHPGVLSA